MRSIIILTIFFAISLEIIASTVQNNSFVGANWTIDSAFPLQEEGSYGQSSYCYPVGNISIYEGSDNNTLYLLADNFTGTNDACDLLGLYSYSTIILYNATEEQALYQPDIAYAGVTDYGTYFDFVTNQTNQTQLVITISSNMTGYSDSIVYLSRDVTEDSSDSEGSSDDLITTNCSSFSINDTAFNLCPFYSSAFNFGQIFQANVTFSLNSENIQSLNQSEETAYGVIKGYWINSNIAEGTPTFDLISENNETQGVKITFPALETSNADIQFIVNLFCDLNVTLVQNSSFTLAILAGNEETTETITANVSSIYGCPLYMYPNNFTNNSDSSDSSDSSDNEYSDCGPIFVSSAYVFNLCAFNGTNESFIVSDALGGVVTFVLSSAPQVLNRYFNPVFATYEISGSTVEVATKKPKYSLFNETDPEQGLTITYPVAPMPYDSPRFAQLIVNLLCDFEEVNPTQISFVEQLYSDSVIDKQIITVTGRSIYGCQVKSEDSIVN